MAAPPGHDRSIGGWVPCGKQCFLTAHPSSVESDAIC